MKQGSALLNPSHFEVLMFILERKGVTILILYSPIPEIIRKTEGGLIQARSFFVYTNIFFVAGINKTTIVSLQTAVIVSYQILFENLHFCRGSLHILLTSTL